jgi:pimeloyl-ACP methyl ester carboxylesterase
VLTFVLVHGLFHDGSTWDRVIDRLEEHGHTAFGPTMVGYGRDAPKHATHAESTQSIVDFIVEKNLSDVVLVGHSYGGTIISKVAEAIPERLQRLVFWSAYVLNDGECLIDVGLPELHEVVSRLAAESPDKTFLVPFYVWREFFMNDADLALARDTYGRLSPASYGQLAERLDLKKFYGLRIPRSYIASTEDAVIPADRGGLMMRKRLGLHRLGQIAGGHELVFTNPVGLADKIIEAARAI